MENLEQPFNSEFLEVLSNLEDTVPREFKAQLQNLMCQVATSKASDKIYQRLFVPDFTHEKICQKLQLSFEDQAILRSYGIDLLQTWNSYVDLR